MRRFFAASTVALTALAAPAHATPIVAGTTCGMVVVSQNAVTGGQDTYTGIVFAVVSSVDSDLAANPVDLHVSCRLLVSGGELDSDPSIVDTAVAVVVAQTAFHAEESEVVTLCTDVEANGDASERCTNATSNQVLPADVCTLLAGLGLPVCDVVEPVTVLSVLPEPLIIP